MQQWPALASSCHLPCPPHVAQTCQRYWTAGGTLRDVPPGSGRRKSKARGSSKGKAEEAAAPAASGAAPIGSAGIGALPPLPPLPLPPLPGAAGGGLGGAPPLPFLDPLSAYGLANIPKVRAAGWVGPGGCTHTLLKLPGL